MVDALASGASIGNDVEVRVLSWAPANPRYLEEYQVKLGVWRFVGPVSGPLSGPFRQVWSVGCQLWWVEWGCAGRLSC